MELRLYSFVNFYMSSIQQGVQTGHAAVDLVRKYTKQQPLLGPSGLHPAVSATHRRMVENWADNHKTFIVLNGGNADGIRSARDIIASNGDFPWVAFCEDNQSLDGMMTCVSVILPENIFSAKPAEVNGGYEYHLRRTAGELTEPFYYPEGCHNYPLIDLVKRSRLAA